MWTIFERSAHIASRLTAGPCWNWGHKGAVQSQHCLTRLPQCCEPSCGLVSFHSCCSWCECIANSDYKKMHWYNAREKIQITIILCQFTVNSTQNRQLIKVRVKMSREGLQPNSCSINEHSWQHLLGSYHHFLSTSEQHRPVSQRDSNAELFFFYLFFLL